MPSKLPEIEPKFYPVTPGRWNDFELPIVLTPAEPVPGEAVVTTARIQNYSLIQTPGPVKVRFFLDDPATTRPRRRGALTRAYG